MDTQHQDFTLDNAVQQLTVTKESLRTVIDRFRQEMYAGLIGEKSTLRMLRSYVTKARGTEQGSYLALDLGGTNFRVFFVSLKDGAVVENQSKSFVVHQDAMKGVSSDLFDFLADCVKEFLADLGVSGQAFKLGFTFSFPVLQSSVNRGSLIAWTKGFDVEGVVGRDVVELLLESFQRKGLQIDVSALVNDTVGTMAACSYGDTDCVIGLILGTGSNACYMEDFSSLPESRRETPTIINMEWGAFDHAENAVLPLTECDKHLDTHSVHPGTQAFEKMISGMYLGEIARLFLRKLIASNHLLLGHSTHILNIPYLFETEYMSRIAGDQTAELSGVQEFLQSVLEYPSGGTLEDRKVISQVCQLVSTRAARLSVAGLVAVLEHMGVVGKKCTIAVDGSVYEKYPGFQDAMHTAFVELLGEENASLISLKLSKDGSSVGAAIIAAITSN
eukprot:TRINITY_DN1797_c0_g2_i1.p1 TRINITY_DN1797_c0_g2~~TRINITY_DN1797_c0_g2_i1.p1  ORF type:complete len:446 (+),score=119.15 TRINITY_DN1797_c0_g2_i1:85-1422(+)